MTESNEQEVLIGDRGLMAYTDRARTTVREWHQRSHKPLPHTINDKGHRVFQIAEVDLWLASRPVAHKGGPDTRHLRLQFTETKEKVRELEQELSELKSAKAANPDKHKQLLEAREVVRALVRGHRMKISGSTDDLLAQDDKVVTQFFNKIQTHLKLNNAPTQNTTEAQH